MPRFQHPWIVQVLTTAPQQYLSFPIAVASKTTGFFPPFLQLVFSLTTHAEPSRLFNLVCPSKPLFQDVFSVSELGLLILGSTGPRSLLCTMVFHFLSFV